MKPKKYTIFGRFAIVIFSLITVLGLLFIIITYLSTTYYHQASTQLLNKDIASHIAEFTSAFNEKGINKQKADSVFKNAMVLSPSAEVYFLDTTGKPIYFHAAKNEVKSWIIPLNPLKRFIKTNGEEFIKGIDPKDPSHEKIFSVAEVRGSNGTQGYIYVILGSKKSESILDLIFGRQIFNLTIKAFITIILLSFFFSFLYLKRIRKNFKYMIDVLEQFESGNFNARFATTVHDELEPVSHAFNKMADLLSSTINKLTKSEQERKNFIAIISHDLRTPLSIARGYSETLLLKRMNDDVSPKEQAYYAQLIYSKIQLIEKMVKQLFELSKMDDVKFEPNREPFVLSEIVREAVDTFQMVAVENKISLKCTQCLYHVWINADISMLERVVQNLVDNALKNTPEGGSIQVSIAVENEELVFKIENEGHFLSADIINWVNFYNPLSDGRPQKQGLGLLIVQKILHLHHTSLKATRNDTSNIFTFRVPIYHLPG